MNLLQEHFLKQSCESPHGEWPEHFILFQNVIYSFLNSFELRHRPNNFIAINHDHPIMP